MSEEKREAAMQKSTCDPMAEICDHLRQCREQLFRIQVSAIESLFQSNGRHYDGYDRTIAELHAANVADERLSCAVNEIEPYSEIPF